MSLPYRWVSQLIRRGWLKVLSRVELVVLLVLGDFMNYRTGETFVGADRISELGALAPSSVYDALARLRKRGLLWSEARQRMGRYRSYTVQMHALVSIEEMLWPPAKTTLHESGEDKDPEIRTEERSETPDRIPPPGNGGTSHLERTSDTLSDHVVNGSRTDPIAADGEPSGSTESPLSRLRELLQEHHREGGQPTEILVRSLAIAGRGAGWTEQDVRMEIAALWPEVRP